MLFRKAVMKNFFTEHLHVAASFIIKKIRRSYHGTYTHLRINLVLQWGITNPVKHLRRRFSQK